MGRRWTIWLCPICGEERPGPEEGAMDLTQPDDERDDEGYLVCDGLEEHEPVRYEEVEVIPAAEHEAFKERLTSDAVMHAARSAYRRASTNRPPTKQGVEAAVSAAIQAAEQEKP